MSNDEIVIFNGHYDSLIENIRNLCCDNFANEDYGTPDNEFSRHARGMMLNMMRNMPKFDECNYKKHMDRCRQAGYLPVDDEKLVAKRHWTWCTIVPLSVLKPKFDKRGKCLCDLCINEDCGDIVPPRETHPFATEVPLVAGNRNKTRKAAPPRRRRNKNKKGNVAVPSNNYSNERARTTVVKATGITPAVNVELSYISETSLAGGGSYIADNYNINNTYDKKGSILTESLLYYNRYSEMYQANIVHKIDYEIVFSNILSDQVTVGIAPSLYNVLVPGSAADARDFLEGPFSKYVVLGPTGGGSDTKTLRYSLDIPFFYGLSGEYMMSGIYACSDVSGPINELYMNLIGYTSGSAINIQYKWNEIDHIRFYNYKVQVDVARVNREKERDEKKAFDKDIVIVSPSTVINSNPRAKFKK